MRLYIVSLLICNSVKIYCFVPELNLACIIQYYVGESNVDAKNMKRFFKSMLLALILAPLTSRADQLAWISSENAEKVVKSLQQEILSQRDTPYYMVSYCSMCDGERVEVWEVKEVASVAATVADYFQVHVLGRCVLRSAEAIRKGEYREPIKYEPVPAKEQTWFLQGVDLAYVYAPSSDGSFICIGKKYKLDCDVLVKRIKIDRDAYARPKKLPGTGTVKGRTMDVVVGYPEAPHDKPDPNGKPPQPKAYPGAKLYWLRIDRENGHQLFSTVSNTNGHYEITLPPGQYLVTPESMHRWELQGLEKNGKLDTNSLIQVLFPVFKRDEKGKEIFCGKPDITVIGGKELNHDVAIRIMFVD